MKIFAPALYKPNFRGFTPYKTHNVNDAVRENDLQIKYDVFAYEKPTSIKTDFGTIHYLKNQKLSELEFNEPLNLSQALRQIQKAQYYHNICSYGLAKQDRNFDLLNMAFSQKFKNMKFTKFLGAGNSALALENEDGKVVKLCKENPFKFREGLEEFDAPVYKKGNIKGQYFYYIQMKCKKEGITKDHVHEMSLKIMDKNYDVSDLFEDQLGFGEDGKLYLLDIECAKSNSKIREFEQNDRDFTKECIKNCWI